MNDLRCVERSGPTSMSVHEGVAGAGEPAAPVSPAPAAPTPSFPLFCSAEEKTTRRIVARQRQHRSLSITYPVPFFVLIERSFA